MANFLDTFQRNFIGDAMKIKRTAPKKKVAKKRVPMRKRPVKAVPKGSFKLQIQTVTIVPSTKNVRDKITPQEMSRRVAETRRFMSNLFGGFTSTRSTGGFVSKGGKLVKERVVQVVAYSEKDKFLRNKQKWFTWIKNKKKAWSQESIGIIIENDLFYI